jgi:hypothetical protein
MGDNSCAQSGIGNTYYMNTVYNLTYFENENLKIKKIVCGGTYFCFNIFLTGLLNLNYFF